VFRRTGGEAVDLVWVCGGALRAVAVVEAWRRRTRSEEGRRKAFERGRRQPWHIFGSFSEVAVVRKTAMRLPGVLVVIA